MVDVTPEAGWLPPGYKPVRLLGQGGMGEVWLAAAPGGASRAVKRMKLTTEGGADRLRFKREFRVLARLTHPGIVRVFDFHETEGSLAYAMEHVEGWELRDYFAGGHWCSGLPSPNYYLQRPALEKLWGIASALLETLGALHADGVVHRDLKPANILVRRDHAVRLIDFGLARSEVETDQQVTGAGEVLGTPLYLSPEQIRAQPLDGRSDLYSLGMILYELAAGRHAFEWSGVAALLAAHLQQSPAPPASINPAITAGESAFILKLTAKEPGGRFPGAPAALETLRLLRAGGGVMLEVTATLRREDILPAGGLLQTPFIGNQRVVENLRAAVNELSAGTGGVRLIAGAPGTGKSRMLDEMRVAAQGRGIRIWRGSGRAAGGSLGQLFQDFMAAAVQEIAARPERIQSWLGLEGPILAHYFPALRPHAGNAGYLPIEGAAEEARLLAALYDFFDRLLRTEKILLLADELHHADPLSARLLSHLASSFSGVSAAAPVLRPLLIIAGLRETETSSHVNVFFNSITAKTPPLRLSPLTPAETGRLTQAALGLSEPPDGAHAKRLHEITGGNPFFILELLRQGYEEGRLAAADGRLDLDRWLTQAQSGVVKLPATLEEAVRARLQGLAEADRSALQSAAIIGSQFRFAWWKSLTGMSEDLLLDIADRLIRAGLLEESGPGLLRFPHGLTRLELEREVSGLKRRRLHRKIVEILATAGDEHRLTLAEHAIDSADGDLTTNHAVPVITILRNAGQFIEVRHLLGRLVQIFGDDPELPPAAQIRFFIDRSFVEYKSGNLQVSIKCARKAAVLAEANGDPAHQVDALIGLYFRLMDSGSTAEVAAGAYSLLALAENLNDPNRLGRVMNLLARAKIAQGELDDAVRYFDCVLELCADESLWVVRALALNDAAVAWGMGGHLAKTRTMFEEALALAQRHGNLSLLALYQSNLAECDWHDGSLASARDRGEISLVAARKSGDQFALINALATLVLTLGELGESAPARQSVEAALAIAGETATPHDVIIALHAQGHLFLCGGSVTQGDGILEAAARKFGYAELMIPSLAVAARIALRHSEPSRAEAIARDIIDITQDKNPSERTIARALLAGLACDEPGVQAALAAADATNSFPAAFSARLAGAEGLLAAKRPAAALQILDDLEPRARDKGFQGTLKQVAMLRAMAQKTVTD